MFKDLRKTATSERIADAEVEAEGVEDGRDVVVGGDGLREVRREIFGVFVGLVGRVDANAQIQTDDEPVQVEAESRAGAQGNLPGEIRVPDDAVPSAPARSPVLPSPEAPGWGCRTTPPY